MSDELTMMRRPLRDVVRELVMARIVQGLHPAGSRIHEGRLATELGVSRTPVREALMHLEKVGVLEVRPNSGFYVIPITATDIREVYPMIGALERAAVKSTDRDKFTSIVSQLWGLADEQQEAARCEPARAQELDDQWHAVLISRCGNDRLMSTVAELKRVVHRYETGYMANPETLRQSIVEHRAIVSALAAGDVLAAADLVEQNWQSGMERLNSWYQSSTGTNS